MAFRLYRYPLVRDRAPELALEPLKGRRKKARRVKAALSGFQGTPEYQDADLASTYGDLTPPHKGQD